MTLQERIKSPTPKFFKKIRNIGVALAAISGSILAAPAALPLVIVKVASYLAVAGTVAAAVSQTSATGRTNKDPRDGKFTSRG
jgi:hypothetical protein